MEMALIVPECRYSLSVSQRLIAPRLCYAFLGLICVSHLVGCGNEPKDKDTLAVEASIESKANTSQVNQDFVELARVALSRNDLQNAEEHLKQALISNPQDEAAIETLGDIAAMQGANALATERYAEAISLTESPSLSLCDKLVKSQLRGGFAWEALDSLSMLVERHPTHLESRFDLIGLSASLGSPDRAVPHVRWLAQHNHSDLESFIFLADASRAEADEERCRRLYERTKDNKLLFGIARNHALKSKWNDALGMLEPIVSTNPNFIPAYTLYGRAILETGQTARIADWIEKRPKDVEQTPDYWFVAGIWAQQQGNYGQAAKAFWNSLRREEANPTEVLVRLATCLSQADRRNDASVISSELAKHIELRDAIKIFLERSSKSQQAAAQVADTMLSLGRVWESEGWARFALTLPQDPVPNMKERYLAIRSQLTASTPWQRNDLKPGRQINLETLPDIEWSTNRLALVKANDDTKETIRLENEAAARALQHTCKIAADAETKGHWIFQSVGGGLGVIDFDLDGWPDIAAAMLDGQPLVANSSSNTLHRNLGKTFVECSQLANYIDHGFAQGITVGDFNDDGFPDIWDCNIGQNRLFQNNGDGTFQDVTVQAGMDGTKEWTSSSCMADLNADGIMDLFAANYCKGPKPYERVCRSSQGKIATCPPLFFEADRDRVWQGKGDGTFQDVSREWLDQNAPGRALGISVGSFDERPGLDVYVANDMTVNHLWSANTNAPAFKMDEIGAARGLGYNARGDSQASMGIAVGDADADGNIDFFVTHFSDDHNTYYEQVSPGFWSDRTSAARLLEPSLQLLGFGTQFCDLDNDGTLELAIANGHVDDVNRGETTFRMKPQVFSRERNGEWTEIASEQLGDYFENKHIGRALVTLDVNRDRKIDILVSHLFEPIALLVNQTKPTGAALCLELKGTSVSRDAIGTVVTMSVGGKRVTHQLTGGHGYMGSNQQSLLIGTGNAKTIQQVEVRWPSGVVESFGDIESDRSYLLVEGEGAAFLRENPPELKAGI